LLGEPERKGPAGRPRHRQEDNIEWNLERRIGWIHLVEDRDLSMSLLNKVMDLRAP
jgi:hypothetical protein